MGNNKKEEKVKVTLTRDIEISTPPSKGDRK